MSLGQPLPPEPVFVPEPVTVGSIIGNTFRVLGQNIVAFSVISALVLLPGIAFVAFRMVSLFSLSDSTEKMAHIMVTLGIFSMLQLFLQIPAQSAMMYGVANQMSGRATNLGESLRRGVSSILPVIGTAIVVGLAIMGGFVLCVIPGIIAMVMLYVAIPVAVVENRGIGDNLRRSSQLTEGYRLSIFLAAIVIGFAVGVVQTIVQQGVIATGNEYAIMIVTVLASVLTMPIQATTSAVTYMLLRQNKDQINVSEIADVFR
ncbi:hypothetical protein L6R29_00925 [Myxococcota bacterium]|nr:hypothetical protein [Myxococcota bacterium]